MCFNTFVAISIKTSKTSAGLSVAVKFEDQQRQDLGFKLV